MKHVASGKVREIYDLDEKSLLIITTDRMSAFDVVMNEPIPDRGRVLTALTQFWLQEIGIGLPNHLTTLDVPEEAAGLVDTNGRTMVVRKAEMLPIEFIIRAYLAGSAWKEYQQTRTLHGKPLPSGLQLGSPLPEPVLTPSTKGGIGEHDVNLSWNQAANVIGVDAMKEAEGLALEMFRRGSEHALKRGLILADTKFELGYIDGTLSLCDEILTPDSSRYWPIAGWELGETPPAFDKQYLRDWLETQPWEKTPPPPELPAEVINATRSRYVEAYELITERSFEDWPGATS